MDFDPSQNDSQYPEDYWGQGVNRASELANNFLSTLNFSAERSDDVYIRTEEAADQMVTPINKRRRKLNNWDIPPPGYEGMTAEQVKATGHFPLPGQPATTRPPVVPNSPVIPGMDPSRAAMIMGMTHELPPRPKVSQGAAGPVAQTASLARQARRLYVGNIPYGIDENGLSEFFNTTMLQLSITTSPGNPVIAVQINHDKNYAFVEFRAPEEATAAMAFDGITFQGQSLKIRRPKDYQPPPGQNLEPPPIHVPGVVSTNVPDSPNKIFIGGLPTYLNDEQVMELLKSFGELRAFNLVKDTLSGISKGFAFCEYLDPSVTDLACQGLNNMELGDRKLVVQRASVGSIKNAGVTTSLSSTVLIPAGNGEMQPTTVLQLLNMVTPEELVDDEEYEDIVEDVREECSKFGRIIDMKIPRPGQTTTGVGKIFVRFDSAEAAGIALRALAGRKFAERTVLTSYFEEEKEGKISTTTLIEVPSVNDTPLTSSYTYHSPKPAFLLSDNNKDVPCVLGVDEAGRGPVLGPMVYGVCYCPISKYSEISKLGFADSKTLKEGQREDHFQLIQSNNDIISWSVRVLSPQDISWNMLKLDKHNLNAQAHETTIQLIQQVLDQGVNLTEIYVDTVGPPDSYQKKLSSNFPSINITVSKKADSKYPIVSAASICAKVTRDHILKKWKFIEKTIISTKFGSGYPSVNWLENNIDSVFGFPNIIRFSWATCEMILNKKAISVTW
ncbi:2611_t:CDS:10 [Entrophospora sp. SA101]|nr:2611_t:CDS:10 [Entrophospora sp. SA101]